MNELLKSNTNSSGMMSSKRIADKTGKTHSHVVRDIKHMIEELKKDEPKLDDTDYQILKDSRGYDSEILLNEKLSLCLASGYSISLRMMIIEDWAEMKKPKELSRRELAMLVIEAEDKIAQLELQVDNMEQVIDCATDWISILRASQHNKVKETTFNWRILKAKSYEMNLPPKMVQSPRYAYQLIYHLNVFRACYPKLNFNIKEDTRNKLKALEK
jgi:phage regulator Rha-like protein